MAERLLIVAAIQVIQRVGHILVPRQLMADFWNNPELDILDSGNPFHLRGRSPESDGLI